MKRTALAHAALVLLAIGLPLAEAGAVTVSPMQVEMTSAGARSHSTVTVINNSMEPMPIEAVVQSMTMDENGKAHTSTAGDEFLVMPPQVIIPPGATQNFRIQWLGEPEIAASQSFFIFFNQVPLKLNPGKPTVQIVMSLGVMVNVAPPEGDAVLELVSTGVAAGTDGKRHPTITVRNPGRVHCLLPKSTIRLTAGAWSQVLTPGYLSEHIGSGLVQPQRQRKFVLPIDLPADVSAVRASLESARRQ